MKLEVVVTILVESSSEEYAQRMAEDCARHLEVTGRMYGETSSNIQEVK